MTKTPHHLSHLLARLTLLGLVVPWALVACATAPRVRVDRVEGDALARAQTFALRPDAAAGPGDPALSPTALATAQEELKLSLRGRGYRLVESAEADLLVAVGTASSTRVDEGEVLIEPGRYDVYTRQTGIGTPLGDVPLSRQSAVVHRAGAVVVDPVGQRTERSVIVDVFDAKTRQLLWRGTSTMSSAARDRINPEELRKRVRAIAERFPGS
jgi:hypothetical protein